MASWSGDDSGFTAGGVENDGGAGVRSGMMKCSKLAAAGAAAPAASGVENDGGAGVSGMRIVSESLSGMDTCGCSARPDDVAFASGSGATAAFATGRVGTPGRGERIIDVLSDHPSPSPSSSSARLFAVVCTGF